MLIKSAGSKSFKTNIGLRINRFQHWFRMTKGNLITYKQKNFSPHLFPALIRERAAWIQVFKNLYVLEGSWTGAIRRFSLLTKGYPKKDF